MPILEVTFMGDEVANFEWNGSKYNLTMFNDNPLHKDNMNDIMNRTNVFDPLTEDYIQDSGIDNEDFFKYKVESLGQNMLYETNIIV